MGIEKLKFNNTFAFQIKNPENMKQIILIISVCLFVNFLDINNIHAQSETFESKTEYDFIPGDKVLFYEDFSETAIGDFPAGSVTNGSGEVKTVSVASGKWLHLNGEDATYCLINTINFPENFILEFDIIPDEEYGDGIILTFYKDSEKTLMNEDLLPGFNGLDINITPGGWETRGYLNEEDTEWLTGKGSAAPVKKQKPNHVIVWIQKQRVRIYHDGKKALDMGTNIHPGTKFNKMRFSGWDRGSWPFISNIKITTASPDNRNKLLTEGKIITYGICFDSGKDFVKAESGGTIREIATIMAENPELRIMIVGHTDSDGDDNLNMDLSKRRAANVKKILVEQYSIYESRIETDGKGESQPIADNNTAENKAKNRRVEIIKL